MANNAAQTHSEETQRRVMTARAERKGRQAVQKQVSHLETLQVTYLPVDALMPNEWNPNRQSEHDFELLLRSMEEDGFTQPVIALKQPSQGRHTIVDGEHRWRAAGSLGLAEIPVVLVDMTPEQARISTIRHNRARGDHDIELEAALLRDLQSLGAIEWAQDSLMLDDEELNRLLTDISAPEALADEDYSDAWIPDSFTDAERALVQDGISSQVEVVHVEENRDGKILVSLTPEAIEAQRRREALISQARTAEERQIASRKEKLYRVNLIFQAEEGEVVRKVLGREPASMLIALCKYALESGFVAATDEDYDDGAVSFR